MIDDLPRWALVLIVAVVGFFAHAPSLDGRFLDWDDRLLVWENEPLRRGGDLGRLLDPFADRADYGHEYLPVRDLSYRLDVALFGLNARGFHATNLVLHAIASGLAFLILIEITGARWASLLGALIYATHPLASEVVDCIAHRKGALMAAFCFGAWLAWLRDQKILAAVLYALAMLSKLPAIVLPGVLAVTDVALRRRFDGRRWVAYGALGILAIADFRIAGRVASFALQQSGPHGGTLFSNALSSGAAFFEGLKLLLLPIGLEAARVNESLTRVSPDLVSVAGIGLLIALVALGAYWIRERPLWGLALLLIPVIQAPYLQIRPFWVLFAERYWILAILPFGLVVGRLLAGTPRRRALGLAIVVMLFFGSYVRARDWRDTAALFQDAARKDATNYIAHDKVGRERARAGRYPEAIASFRRALDELERYRPLGQGQLQEVESNTLIGLSNSLVQAGRHRQTAPYVARLREGWPDDVRVQAYVAFLDGLAAQSAFNEMGARLESDRLVYEARIDRLSDIFAEAEREYREALTLAGPNRAIKAFSDVWTAGHRNLALLYYQFGVLHVRARKYDRAEWLIERAAELDPTNADIERAVEQIYGLRRSTQRD